MFLLRVEAAVSVYQVEALVKKYLDKFFKDYNLPMPKIKIVDRITANYLGRCIYSPHIDTANSTIEIQKGIINDETTLGKVICHELIHHFRNVTYFGHPTQGEGNRKKDDERRKLGFKDGHGAEFHEWAAKINAVMGKDYVTEKSDESYVIEGTKEYYMLVLPVSKNSNNYAWAWTVKPSDEQKAEIQRLIREHAGRLFKSKDTKWLTGDKIKKYGSASIPRDEDKKKALEEMYKSGTDIKPNWPLPISKLSDLHTKKLVQHYGQEMKEFLDKNRKP